MVSDCLESIMKRYGTEWEIPKLNENGEWVCLGKKYVMVVLPEEEKQKYIEKMTSFKENKSKNDSV